MSEAKAQLHAQGFQPGNTQLYFQGVKLPGTERSPRMLVTNVSPTQKAKVYKGYGFLVTDW